MIKQKNGINSKTNASHKITRVLKKLPLHDQCVKAFPSGKAVANLPTSKEQKLEGTFLGREVPEEGGTMEDNSLFLIAASWSCRDLPSASQSINETSRQLLIISIEHCGWLFPPPPHFSSFVFVNLSLWLSVSLGE